MRFFFSPEAAVFFPASFFSGALEAVAGALEAGFLSAALGAILKVVKLEGFEKKAKIVRLRIRVSDETCGQRVVMESG